MESIILDPQTGKSLTKIFLVGDPVPADRMISTSGKLQGYVILSKKENLWRPWMEQQKVLLRTKDMQHLVRIVTFPTTGDQQGYLDVIGTVGGDE